MSSHQNTVGFLSDLFVLVHGNCINLNVVKHVSITRSTNNATRICSPPSLGVRRLVYLIHDDHVEEVDIVVLKVQEESQRSSGDVVGEIAEQARGGVAEEEEEAGGRFSHHPKDSSILV